MSTISRRSLVKTAGALGAIGLSPAARAQTADTAHALHQRVAQAAAPSISQRAPEQSAYIFLNADEAAFIESAIARLIPADARWPGALEAGVANFLDKQLGGAWGAGERFYRSGPWQTGTPSQGYQLPLTPAELFRTAIAAIHKELAAKQTPFVRMTPQQQDAYLTELETSDRAIGGIPAKEFFAHLWESTLEGFFGDPVYGGNRDMVSWRMLGFPGAYASYFDVV